LVFHRLIIAHKPEKTAGSLPFQNKAGTDFLLVERLHAGDARLPSGGRIFGNQTVRDSPIHLGLDEAGQFIGFRQSLLFGGDGLPHQRTQLTSSALIGGSLGL
jgi:hypothetical protein